MKPMYREMESVSISITEDVVFNGRQYHLLMISDKEYRLAVDCAERFQELCGPAFADYIYNNVPVGAFITDFAISYFDNRVMPVYRTKDILSFEYCKEEGRMYLKISDSYDTMRKFPVTDVFQTVFGEEIPDKTLDYIFRNSQAELLDAGWSLFEDRPVLIEREDI